MIGKHKQYGIVYTPEWIVDLILDGAVCGYTPVLKICDPACGDGAFLARLVGRICDAVPARDCRRALENLSGFDIDADALAQCERRLDAVLVAKGKRLKIQWNLHCMDSTDRASLAPHAGRFDCVVGNPPYVRIQHLGEARRKRMQRDWKLANRGSADLYIAFFEIGMFLLKRGGRLGYITPNTYAKTMAGQPLRRFIREQHGIVRLIDFGEHQVFDGATTYSLITVLHKNNKLEKFALCRYDGKRIVSKGMVSASNLPAKRFWTLESENTLREIERIRARGRPLGEIAGIHVGLQTLADDVFIMEKQAEDAGVVVALDARGREMRIESAVTRPILKASLMKDGKDAKERIIIFPYIGNRLFAEDNFKEQFPMAYRYMAEHKTLLLKRDKGKFDSRRWYAFGREFGLFETFGEKLVTSGMNKRPNFQKCPAPEYTFYSGYCVKPKAGVDLDALLAVLNSDEMDFYIRHTSRDYQNGWKSYAKSFIQDYGVPATVAGCAHNDLRSPMTLTIHSASR
ncbi:MAG: Eco57I restriction-modification methylase domain-containing protein [Gammaproteobacteria bacterium]|nr:Eco57I restriction-modification methylase domain-containing protein [Gammaproteobacteria bacterium]